MNRRRVRAGLLSASLVLGGALFPQSADAEWDFNQKIEHVNDGVDSHECASDFHLKLAVDAGKIVTVKAALTEDPATLVNGAVQFEQEPGGRKAVLSWDFDPCIERGEEVQFVVHADGTSTPPEQAWWTYPSGRGPSIVQVGPRIDPETWLVTLVNTDTEAVVGTLRLGDLAQPRSPFDLSFGTLPDLGPFLPLDLEAGEALSFPVTPVTPGAALILEIDVTGVSSGRQQQAVFQFSQTVLEVPGTTTISKLLLALAIGGAALWLLAGAKP